MPASYTHQLLAENILEDLPVEIKSKITVLAEYYLGAQGGDVWYFHKAVGSSKNLNLGKYFHRCNIYNVFSLLLKCVKDNQNAFSYAAGYITHYAVDTVFHPYVYYTSKEIKMCPEGWRGNKHALIESDLDTYFVNKELDIPVGEYSLPYTKKEVNVSTLAPVIRRISSFTGGRDDVTEVSLKKAINSFFRAQAFFSDRKYGLRKFLYGAESFFGAPHTLSSLCRKEEPDKICLNEQNQEWYYLADPTRKSNESAEELYQRARKEGGRLIKIFYSCMTDGSLLPREDFGKHFLTGIGEGEGVADEKGNSLQSANKPE